MEEEYAELARPTAPTGLSGKPDGGSGIALSWTNNADDAFSTHIERAAEGGDWEEAFSIQEVLTEYVDSPGGGSYKYRVRYASREGVYSDYSNETGYMAAGSLPIAPTLTAPESGATVAADAGTVRLEWIHSPTNGTAQSSAEVAWSPDGEEHSYATVGEEQYYDLSVEGNGDVCWMVRTKGEGSDYGPWSGPSTFSVRTRPKASLSVPATVRSLPIPVSWDYEDEAGEQASAELSILDSAGTAVFSKALGAESRAYTVQADQFTPENGRSYTLTLTVTSTTSLSASAQAEFKASYDAPGKPDLALSVRTAEHRVDVTVFSGPGEGSFPKTKSLSVHRDGKLIASGLASGQTALDRTPPLDRQVTYKVTAYSDTGAASSRTETVVVRSFGFAVFNFGTNWAQVAKLSLNLEETDKTSGERELYQVASSKYPKAFFGTRSTRSGSVTGDVAWKTDAFGQGRRAMLPAIEKLKEHNGLVYMRLPYRDALYVSCDVQTARSSTVYNVANVTIDWQAIDS